MKLSHLQDEKSSASLFLYFDVELRDDGRIESIQQKSFVSEEEEVGERLIKMDYKLIEWYKLYCPFWWIDYWNQTISFISPKPSVVTWMARVQHNF